MNYYSRHIGDYAKKAGHLSLLEHGVYTVLLDRYYEREQGVTKAEAIRWTRARTQDELAAVDAVLSEFFYLQDGRYLQARVEEEFTKWAEYQQKQSDKGKKGGRPRKAVVKPEESRSFSDESQEKAGKSQSTNPLSHLPVEAKALGDKSPGGFAIFWKAYPNKKGKTEAEKVWKRRKLDAKLPAILADVAARRRSDPDWQRGAIPHGSTYVNQERWEDAIAPDAPAAATASTAGSSPVVKDTPESQAKAAAMLADYAKELGYA